MMAATENLSTAALRAAVVDAVLASCLDVTAVWSVGHAASGHQSESAAIEIRLLVFGTRQVLERLRKCDRLHDARVQLLVVVDGDAFEAAWGAHVGSASLACWAWRQISPVEAFYDESCWSGGAQSDGVVARIRRRAFLLWPRPERHEAGKRCITSGEALR
jgi:hypothetical protein